MSNEIWKPCPFAEATYLVSNHGNIMRIEHYIKFENFKFRNITKKIEGYTAKLTPNRRGYVRTRLNVGNSIRISRPVHRLVALAFIPNPYNKPTVNHIDGNKSNNHVSNLEWATQSEQNMHAIHVLKLYKPPLSIRKISIEDAEKVYVSKEDKRILAKRYGVHVDTIENIRKGRRKDLMQYFKSA